MLQDLRQWLAGVDRDGLHSPQVVQMAEDALQQAESRPD